MTSSDKRKLYEAIVSYVEASIWEDAETHLMGSHNGSSGWASSAKKKKADCLKNLEKTIMELPE